jgi:hypothetical protein
VIYLGNDLFDNLRAFPLQGENAKPFFEMKHDTLIMRNVPVPLARKGRDVMNSDLNSIVLGNAPQGDGSHFLNRSHLLRLLGFTAQRLQQKPDFNENQEFAWSIDLFTRLLKQTKNLCETHEAELRLALLPGRSFVAEPASVSAAYQDYFRVALIALGDRPGLPSPQSICPSVVGVT